MRKWRVWGWGAVLIMGLSGSVVFATDDPADTPDPKPVPSGRHDSNLRTLFRRMNQEQQPASEKKITPAPRSAARKVDKAAEGKANSAKQAAREEAIAARACEEANLLRRQAVCFKLMELAAQANDKELQRLAEQLNDRSWEAYSQRTAHLPATSAPVESDDPSLDKPKVAKSGPSTTAKSKTVVDMERPSHEVNGEEKP